MKLQHLDVLLDDVRGGTVLLVSDQLLIGLHNVRQLVSQVVLGGREGRREGGGREGDGSQSGKLLVLE